MHTPSLSLVKIDIYSSYCPEMKIQIDGRMTGRHTDSGTDTRTANVIPSYPTTIVWQGIKIKNIINLSSAEFAWRVVKFKECVYMY